MGLSPSRPSEGCSIFGSWGNPVASAAIVACVLLAAAGPARANDPAADRMLAYLQQKVAKDPNHGDTWRLLGKVYAQQGRSDEAFEALERSIEVDPVNAAAHFDLGMLLAQTGQQQRAEGHLQRVFILAPASTYAVQLRERGVVPWDVGTTTNPAAGMPVSAHPVSIATAPIPNLLAPTPGGVPDIRGAVQTASYEIQTFDGADDLDRRFQQLESDAKTPENRFRSFVEAGLLYNSNVALTPISRQPFNVDASSFQAFVNPEVEWIAHRHGNWKSGPLLRGFFTENESDFRNFDLASFQPGLFAERSFLWGESEISSRIDYVYALDLFGGSRLGDRHALTLSTTSIRPDLDVIYAYATASVSDFADDGVAPATDSLDGPSWTLGISRFFHTGASHWTTWSSGIDVESAHTEGEDYRYAGVRFHADATRQLSERWSLVPEGSIGYRNYYDFSGPVNRDELTFRLGSRLRYQLNAQWSVSAVASHDRFASENKDFDTERTQGGIVATFLH